MTVSALVLGGGGVTGIAWELGVLKGLRDAGVDLARAGLVVGTSAGSVVGAQLATGLDLDDLVTRQRSPATGERASGMEPERMVAAFSAIMLAARDPRDLRVRIGTMALGANTISEAERLEVIRSRLPVREWPEQRLLITGVDAVTGDPVVWDREAGVPLVQAVAASCAVPGVWPPVTIAGRRYIDGGIASPTNAHLAAGCDAVVVLAPIVVGFGGSLDEELKALGPDARVAVVSPDAAAEEAIGPDVLDPSRRPPAVEAGLAQGAAAADEVRAVWAPAP
jgi:NTE family protein